MVLSIIDQKMQIEQIKIFANQIDEKSKEYDKLIITGDSNLCANKWNNETDNGLHKYELVAQELCPKTQK